MKKLSNLKGAKALNKQEQKSVNGGHSGCFRECGPLGGYPHPLKGCICY